MWLICRSNQGFNINKKVNYSSLSYDVFLKKNVLLSFFQKGIDLNVYIFFLLMLVKPSPLKNNYKYKHPSTNRNHIKQLLHIKGLVLRLFDTVDGAATQVK